MDYERIRVERIWSYFWMFNDRTQSIAKRQQAMTAYLDWGLDGPLQRGLWVACAI